MSSVFTTYMNSSKNFIFICAGEKCEKFKSKKYAIKIAPIGFPFFQYTYFQKKVRVKFLKHLK